MLLQFNFKNFKSFKDDTILDLSATKISEFNNHVVSIANEKVLPVAAILQRDVQHHAAGLAPCLPLLHRQCGRDPRRRRAEPQRHFGERLSLPRPSQCLHRKL